MAELTKNEAIEEGMRLHRLGRPSEAEAVYRQILADTPEHPPALHLLGVLESQANNQHAAIDFIRRALARDPQHSEYWENLGTAYRRIGSADQAIACYQNALALRPDFDHALNNLGVSLRDKGMYPEAIAAFKKALAANADFLEARINLGGVYQLMGRCRDAVETMRIALAKKPADPTIHHNLAANLRMHGDMQEVIPLLREALRLDPNYADAHNTLSAALMDVGNYETALAHARLAAELNPNLVEAFGNLGAIYKMMGRLDEAVEANLKAIALNPKFNGAYWNLGLIHLLRGNFAEGLPLYEQRLNVKQLNVPSQPFKPWDGSDLRGKRILVVAEQGLGDTIQFVRYVPRIAAMGATIYLGIPHEVVDLIKGSIKVEKFILHGESCPPCDFHIPMMSLPYIFKTDLATIPSAVPYLNPSPDLVRHWKRKMPASPNRRPRVGLVWSGRPTHRNDRERSIKLAQLAPLASEHILFFSLQKGDAAEQAKTPPPGMELLDFTADLRNFADTAALIAQLDLVIAVDTAVAHLAGAMAKPTWLILPTIPDFRWMLDREDSPWYPTTRIFRQRTARDWRETIERVAAALRERVA